MLAQRVRPTALFAFTLFRRRNVNLLGHVVAFKRGGIPDFGIVESIEQHKIVHTLPAATEAPIEDSPAQITTDHKLNNYLSTIRYIGVKTMEKESHNMKFPISAIDFIFFQPDLPCSFNVDTKRHIINFCKAFEEIMEEHRNKLQETYYDTTKQLGLMFTVDDFIDDFENLGLAKKLGALLHPLLYSKREMMQFALFWWISFGSGKQSFEQIETNPSFIQRKQLSEYPFTYAGKGMNQKGAGGSQTGGTTEIFDIVKEINQREMNVEVKAQTEQISQLKQNLIEGRQLIDNPAFVIDTNIHVNGEDAISLGPKEGAHQWLFVHISDIAHFVPFDSPVDIFARHLSRTTYLKDNTITMLPRKLSSMFSLNRKINPIGAPTFSYGALLDDSGNIHAYKIFLSWIPEQNLRNFSFHKVDILLHGKQYQDDEEKSLATILRYSNALFSRRKVLYKDIANLNYRTNVPTFSSLEIVRELMLLSGFIAGNISQQTDTSLLFRENLGPKISTKLEKKWEITPICKDLITTQPMSITSRNPMIYQYYAPVSAPLRKYHDLLNQYQLRNLLLQKDHIPATMFQSLLPKIAKMGRLIASKQDEYLRSSDMKLLESIAKDGEKLFIAKIIEVQEGVVSGKYAVRTQLQLIQYPSITFPYKLRVPCKSEAKIGQRVQLQLLKINAAANILEFGRPDQKR